MHVPRFVYGETVVCPDAVWLCIPKNASRTMLHAMLERGGRRIVDFPDVRKPLPWLSLQPQRFTFAFCRSPYERLVSGWREKISRSPKGIANIQETRGVHFGMNLGAFVHCMAQNAADGVPFDKHFLPQAQFLADQEGRLCVDWLGRMERFAPDYAVLAERLGFEPSPLHRNPGPEHDPETDVLSPEDRSIVAELYAEDFKLLGYPV